MRKRGEFRLTSALVSLLLLATALAGRAASGGVGAAGVRGGSGPGGCILADTDAALDDFGALGALVSTGRFVGVVATEDVPAGLPASTAATTWMPAARRTPSSDRAGSAYGSTCRETPRRPTRPHPR